MSPSRIQEVPVRCDQLPSQVKLVTEQLEKPLIDKRDYRLIRLENGLEVFLIHDPDTDKASAALNAHVGNFSDEPDMPGMAHAVEHLLFMGTKKFPVENEYSKYLSANSGRYNAATYQTFTVYYLDVAAQCEDTIGEFGQNSSPLHGALDRFSQFFIEPLFDKDRLERELNAVDSEHKGYLQLDDWRLWQLQKSLSNPKHPFCQFNVGNIQTLKTLPEAKGINIRDKFTKFFSDHYSANRMSLVVLGKESLDVLQNWVTELFSPITNSSLKPNRWSDEPPLRKSDLGKQCFAKPILDLKKLLLCFPFLDQEHMFACCPGRLIGHLIGHEGHGSIYSYIKSKGWATALVAGAYNTSPGSPDIFLIDIDLTDEGLKNYTEIVKVVFQYINLLREKPIPEWIFQEKKQMGDIEFDFRQETSPIELTRRISSQMQGPIPREWLLDINARMRVFEPQYIEEGLVTLRPDNFRMIVVSQNYPGSLNEREKWYSTEYRYGDIPKEFMAKIQEAASISPDQRIPELFLPERNKFIPSQLTVHKQEIKKPALGFRLLRNDSYARTWWKKDDTFWVPRANVTIYLKTPLVRVSADNMVKAKLFSDIVCDALNESLHAASLAGLNCKFDLNTHGLFVEIKGYNDKLGSLLEEVISTIRNIQIKPERFMIAKEKLGQKYNEWQIKPPYEQADDYHAWLNTDAKRYIKQDLFKELPYITTEAIQKFHQEILDQLYIEICVHGNLDKEDALSLTNMVQSILKPRALNQNQWHVSRSLLLPPGSNFVYNQVHKDPSNINNCVDTWFCTGDRRNREIRAKTLLVQQLLSEPFFDQLRTKEQLGYVVWCTTRSSFTTGGVYFLIQGESLPGYLDSRIESFLDRFNEVLNNISEHDLEKQKQSLIGKRLEKPKDLDEETSQLCEQIQNEYYDFGYAEKEVENIKSLTKADMVAFFNKYLHPFSNQRARLSVHIHAQKVKQRMENDHQTMNENDVRSTRETAQKNGVSKETTRDGITAVQNTTEITDVRVFKSKLAASPGPQPVKDITEFMI